MNDCFLIYLIGLFCLHTNFNVLEPYQGGYSESVWLNILDAMDFISWNLIVIVYSNNPLYVYSIIFLI